MSSKSIKIYIILLIFALSILATKQHEELDEERSLSRQKRLLFYPTATTWQLSMALVAQVSYITSHRVAINSGFVISYGLPSTLAQIYKAPFWASRAVSNFSSPITAFIKRLAESDDDFSLGGNQSLTPTEFPLNSEDSMNENEVRDEIVENVEELNDNEVTTTEAQTTTKKSKKKRKPKVKRDLTAAEFYSGIKDTLGYAGYHEDCLLKSICELAKHPLADNEHDLLYEILHFVLTPSVHQSFDGENEKDEKKLYEEAEFIGSSGGDCEAVYGTCETSPIHHISNYVDEEYFE